MADIGNIKPPGPIWPQPNTEKVNHKEDHSQQQRHDPSSDKDKDKDKDRDKDKDDFDNGIDEYA